MDNKGQSTGFALIIGLIMLFLLGIGFVVFDQVLEVHITPVSENLLNNSPYLNDTEVNDIKADNDKYMSFWASMPFILVFLVIIYMVVTSFRKGDERYG